MADHFSALTDSHIQFIEKQHIFFVGTAGAEGSVNLSPKGADSFRVVNPTKIVWLNLTGSGNETAAHVRATGRMTLMFCAFAGDPFILRTYGRARVIHPRDPEWNDHYALFPDFASARNIFVLDIDLVTTSCGSGVPEMSVVRNRGETDLEPWYAEMGPAKIRAFWQRKNMVSLDDQPTGIFT